MLSLFFPLQSLSFVNAGGGEETLIWEGYMGVFLCVNFYNSDFLPVAVFPSGPGAHFLNGREQNFWYFVLSPQERCSLQSSLTVINSRLWPLPPSPGLSSIPCSALCVSAQPHGHSFRSLKMSQVPTSSLIHFSPLPTSFRYLLFTFYILDQISLPPGSLP